MKIVKLNESGTFKYQWYKAYLGQTSTKYKNNINNLKYFYIWLPKDYNKAKQLLTELLNGNSNVIFRNYTSHTNKEAIRELVKSKYILLKLKALTNTPDFTNSDVVKHTLTTNNRNIRNRNTPYITHHIDGVEINNQTENKLDIFPAEYTLNKNKYQNGKLPPNEISVLNGVHWIIENSPNKIITNNTINRGQYPVAQICFETPDTNTPRYFYDVYLTIK